MALGLAAAGLLLAALFAPIYVIEINTLPCDDVNPALEEECSGSGSIALLLLAATCVLMTVGAGPGRSRPAALALVVTGVVVLAIALALDLPKLDETGAIGLNFDRAEAGVGIGFFFELVGGVLAIAAGALRLLRTGG